MDRRNALTTIFGGAIATGLAGCNSVPTNTRDLVNSPTKHYGFRVSTDRQQMTDCGARYVAVPSNKTFSVNGEIIPREAIADSYAVPDDDFKMQVYNGNATFSTRNPEALFQVRWDKGKVVPNTTGKEKSTTVIYSKKPLEIDSKSKGIVRRDLFKRENREFDGLWIGGEYFQRLPASEKEMKKRTFSGSTPYIFFKDAKPSETMTVQNGRTNWTQQVEIVQYVQAPANMVEMPQPKTEPVKKKKVLESVVETVK